MCLLSSARWCCTTLRTAGEPTYPLEEPHSHRGRYTVDDYAQWLSDAYAGGRLALGAVQQTLGGQATIRSPQRYAALAQNVYAANGPVFACMMVRQLVFSSVRFRWQRLRDNKPSDFFGTRDLRILERPWVGAQHRTCCRG